MLIFGLGCEVSSAERERLTVFAAASLSDAVAAAAQEYASSRPGLVLIVSTGSSTALRTQIEQGAPADVFLAADKRNPAALVEADLTQGASRPFAGNQLALIVPLDNPANLRSAADLTRAGLRIVAAGEQVPISGYASQLLENLARLEGMPSDLPERYTANVVSREDDVRAVLAKVELGEADAAIVYETDVRGAQSVIRLPLPNEAQVAVDYAGVVVRGPNSTAGHLFLEWLAGPAGQPVMARFGFVEP